MSLYETVQHLQFLLLGEERIEPFLVPLGGISQGSPSQMLHSN